MKKLLSLLLFGLPLFVSAQRHVTEITAQMRQLETAMSAGNWQTVAQAYTNDAVMIGTNHEVKGRENINAYFQRLAGTVASWTLENVEMIKTSNTSVVQRGISRLSYKNSNRVDVVRYTSLWVKEGRTWKMRIDHYTEME
jgi:uncharacterized protein (TIGR02246 family)